MQLDVADERGLARHVDAHGARRAGPHAAGRVTVAT
jgi:hypothetical protein